MFRSHGVIRDKSIFSALSPGTPSAETLPMTSLIAAGHSRQQAAHSAHSPPERFSPEPSPQLQIPFAFVYMTSGNTQQKLLTNSFHACAVTLRGELVPLGPSAQGTYLSLLRGVTSPPPSAFRERCRFSTHTPTQRLQQRSHVAWISSPG